MDTAQGPTRTSAGFSLEMDDRTDEERARDRRNRARQGLGMEGPAAPMDTDYQEEMEPTTPKVMINLNFVKERVGIPQPCPEERDIKRFDRQRLFEGAASGDSMRLEGLYQYLHQNLKKLSNTEYASSGKNALMKALLNLQDGRNNTVEYLLEISQRMGDLKEFVNAEYTNAFNKGNTSLHIAIERRSLHYVQLLVSKGANVHARACGTFFQKHKGPSFYFGELPLSLAACTNQVAVVDYLMENEHQRADVRESDSQGNAVLHALVLVADNSPENTEFVTAMYDHILIAAARLLPKWRLEDAMNHRKQTPIKLAAKTGKIRLFEHILHREFQRGPNKHLSRKFTEWVYGPVHSSLYDLADLDSCQDHSCQSVLEILVYGTDIPNRHKMLQIEPLSQLLDDKWSRSARYIFVVYFLFYLFYLFVFTYISYNKKGGEPPFPIDGSRESYLYLSGQLFMVVSSIYFLIKGLTDMRRKRPKMSTLLIDGYFELLFLTQAVFLLMSAGLYWAGSQGYLGFLVVSLALSWVNLLYYFRGNKHMGIYSVMIQKMIMGDIIRFLFVYLVFLLGFSAAVVTLLIQRPAENATAMHTFFEPKANGGCKTPTYRDFPYTMLELFKFTIGMGDLEFTEQYQYKEVFYVLIISYIILTYILLLNMLIALMSRTVEQISQESASIWLLQRAITIMDLEKGLPGCLWKKRRSGVEKSLGAPSAGEDLRWCFSVEVVNWTEWTQNNLGMINEDPGSRGPATHYASNGAA